MRMLSPIYPPFLQETVDHASRLVLMLTNLDSRTMRRPAQRWLVGRATEVECVVDALTLDWRRGAMSDASTTGSINAYLHLVHRGLALHFGELAPSCCIGSLVITASPASFLDVTTSFPTSARAVTVELQSTWEVVDDAQLLDVTYVPRSE